MPFQIHHSATSCLPNTCIVLHMMAKLKIFVAFFSGTTMPGFLKFGFSWFQGLYKSAISCDVFSDSSLDNFLFTKHLYDFTHDSQVENFRHIFLRNYNTFLKFGFRVHISQLYCVVHFQIHHSITSY